MSDHSSFRPDLNGRARRDFMRDRKAERQLTSREEFNKRVMNGASERVDRVRYKLSSHIRKNKERWVHQEMTKLEQQNPLKRSLSMADGPRPPHGLSYKGPTRGHSLYKQARSNVEHRCDLKRRRIDRIERSHLRKISLTHKQT